MAHCCLEHESERLLDKHRRKVIRSSRLMIIWDCGIERTERQVKSGQSQRMGLNAVNE
jgi:hypothetical protein